MAAATVTTLSGVATLGLLRAAGRACDAPRGSVQHWDARTSANDWRAALSLAHGARVGDIDPTNGTTWPNTRQERKP